jgi:acyl-coenzyme A synthetase/AMP-(fatty) acid ligase
VPTVVAMLLNMQDLKKYDFSSVRYMTNTGQALPVEHIRKIRSLFPHIKFFSMFGLTECKRVSYLPPEEIDRRPGSVGISMPNCKVFIVDDNGREVEPGQNGELVIRGSNVMQGYWNDRELTAINYKMGNYAEDRILHSGDYFKKDEDGYLYFISRKNDMIKSRGERISAKEIESTLSSMPGVAEVAVIGIPDKTLGQAIKVFLVPKPGVKITEKETIKFCSLNLEIFAIPKYVVISSFLPKTPHGKIDKKQLKTY